MSFVEMSSFSRRAVLVQTLRVVSSLVKGPIRALNSRNSSQVAGGTRRTLSEVGDTKTMYIAEERGSPYAPDYRVYFRDECGPISPMHDIPLWADQAQKVANMVVEVPRWSNAKMEISLGEPLNPIKQDVKKGNLRFVANVFPHHGYPWNYGALPQTWENPEHVDGQTQARGDNDPIDVVEIGERVHSRGSVVPVKILGTLALIDEGETDWKLLAIDSSDPKANELKGVQDIERIYPGLLRATVEWFRMYKVPDGKPPNQFAFNGEAKDAAFAHGVIEEVHEFWRALVMGKGPEASDICKTNVTVEGSPHLVERSEAAALLAKAPPRGLPQSLPVSEMLGGVGGNGGGEPAPDSLLTVTIARDEHGYGMKVSGDNPVYVQSVKERGAAWRAGLRAGDRIVRVDAVPVMHHTHQHVVHMIRANPTIVLTVQQNAFRYKAPITAPLPVNMDDRGMVSVLHFQRHSSPEHLEHEVSRSFPAPLPSAWDRRTPPSGTPPPPYATHMQPCADPQRAIISMEEDDPPTEPSAYGGLFSNLRSVRESKLRTAVLLNWLLGERRCASASLLLIITDGYRASTGVSNNTLRRWAYEIQSTFLMPNAVLQLKGVEESMANEIEQVLSNEYDKDDLLRNVFHKARQKANEELSQQLTEFQVKRQVGLGTLYGPEDAIIEKCDVDKLQEQIIVERLLCQRLSFLAGVCGSVVDGGSTDGHHALLAALIAAALTLQCRPASVAAAVGGSRATFLQRDKLFKQRIKQIAKRHPQPLVVRGHHLQLQALTAVGHCHHCNLVIWGLAPQAYVCTDCKLCVHHACAKAVEEGCCLDSEHHSNRVSKLMEQIHHAQPGEPQCEGSVDESALPGDIADAKEHHVIDSLVRLTSKPKPRGVNRAESCRERNPPRRGKHRNASDPNRLTAHDHHDLELSAATVSSDSSSSSSLSSCSIDSNALASDQQASHSDWSEEEDPLAMHWTDSLPPCALDSMLLGARMRKRQEVIHELIVSEGSHVRWLKVLEAVFLRPLEKQPSLIPAEELHSLFPNLPGVRERHSKLYADLKAARNEAPNHIVRIQPIADAMVNTLGDCGYASCLSRFCRSQRMALEALRERRRKSKELHTFLCGREQLPLCGRLQLTDLLACVWQRLTKYQLLLESILKTVSDNMEEDDIGEEDILGLKCALEVTKEVLHSVDTAISAAENEHRLRSIQSKLEVRIPCAGPEWEETKRLDLISSTLRMEGELNIRNDSNKKMTVLALMLQDSLVLLQREGDRFVLRPIPQPNQQGLLSPHIRWDRVLFRPNAAVRNTFFLMNINGVQMHELSCNTATEYQLWVKHMQELPLAKPELKPSLTIASNAPSRSIDDSDVECGKDRTLLDCREREQDTDSIESQRSRERNERSSMEKDETSESNEYHNSRRLNVGRVCVHSTKPTTLSMEPSAALTVRPPAATLTSIAHTAYTHQDLSSNLREVRLSRGSRIVDEVILDESGTNMHQLLSAAQAQANQLTNILVKSLKVNETTTMEVWSTRSLCDMCKLRNTKEDENEASAVALATGLFNVTCSLQGALGRLLGALPALEAERCALRAELVAERERGDLTRVRTGYLLKEEMSCQTEIVDEAIQDQPSNDG